MRQYWKYLKYMLAIFVLLWTGLYIWKIAAEPAAHQTPDYPQISIAKLLEKDTLTAEDYRILWMQTGLSKSALDACRQEKKEEVILQIQQSFFANPEIVCEKNSPISWEESIAESDASGGYGCKIVALEDGDILITPCSHTFGWRNGHAALVINAKERQTLESVVLGERSCIQSADKWERYPAFLVLRLANDSQETGNKLTKNALLLLNDLPYGFFGDIFEHIGPSRESRSTHCAHLIWKAYSLLGYDIDGDGGIIVTPKDIAESEVLEVVQVYGISLGEKK